LTTKSLFMKVIVYIHEINQYNKYKEMVKSNRFTGHSNLTSCFWFSVRFFFGNLLYRNKTLVLNSTWKMCLRNYCFVIILKIICDNIYMTGKYFVSSLFYNIYLWFRFISRVSLNSALKRTCNTGQYRFGIRILIIDCYYC
jgi:hypothetical protein